MAQNWTDNCYEAGHVGQTDLQNMENNFQVLKSCFSGSASPSSATAGMLWFNTSTGILYQRNSANTAWKAVWRVDAGTAPANSIPNDALQSGCVTESKIANSSITTSKIANDAVDRYKIKDGEVVTANLGNSSVTNSKIADSAITRSKISSREVIGSKLAAGTTLLCVPKGIQQIAFTGPTIICYEARLQIPEGTEYLKLFANLQQSGAGTVYCWHRIDGNDGNYASTVSSGPTWVTATTSIAGLAGSDRTIQILAKTSGTNGYLNGFILSMW